MSHRYSLSKLIKVTIVATSGAGALAGFSGPLNAQESAGLQEITVTARKINESLQDTPLAVTAFSQERLEEIGLETLNTISTSTPNLQIQRGAGGASTIAPCMRGMCRTDSILTEEPMVGIYIDGYYIPKALGAYFELLDVEQIEVLRGPQGTLFGKNTVGGAILVNTVRPSDEFSGKIVANFGSDNLHGGKAAVNLPIIDGVLATRVSLMKRERDGLIENLSFEDHNNRDVQSGRVAVAFTPTDSLTFDYTYDRIEIDQTPNPWQLTAVGDDVNLFFPGISQWASEDYRDTFDTLQPTYDKVDSYFQALTVTWETDVGTFKSMTGNRKTESSNYRTNLPYYFISGEQNGDVEFFSQEFQYVTSLMDDRLDLVVGVFASNEDYEWGLDQEFGAPIPVTKINLDGETDTWAVFAEATYQINEHWSASLGGRYTEEEKSVDSVLNLPLSGASDVPISQLAPEDEFDTDNFAPRATVSYRPSDKVTYYGSYSVGYKSGGLNGRATQPADFSVYDDAKGTSYEVGAKSELWERRLRLNVAVFYQELEDWQVQVNSFDNRGTFLSRIENAAEANMTGAELEGTVLLTAGFELSGSVGWIDPEYDEYSSLDFATGQVVDVADSYNFQFAPEWTYNLSARYETELDRMGVLLARVDWAYVGDQHFVVNPSPLIEGNDYQLVDARLELGNILDSGFTLALWGKNLTDEEYRTGGFDVASLGITGGDDGMYANSWGDTRTWGVDIRYDW